MKSTKAPRGITLKGEGLEPHARARDVAPQKAWAYAVAEGIERGELPTASNERRRIALILREAADQLRADPPRAKGNPNFLRKLPDEDTVALMVGYEIAFGADEQDAIAKVADKFDVDPSTVGKLFRKRRLAVADEFSDNPDLAHRCGAIRGE